jgi:predicted signal transduction protein with EAL and GGDEF domain
MVGEGVSISASIGIALYSKDGMNPEGMLKNAAAAMYHAKIKRRNDLQYYSKSMTGAAQNNTGDAGKYTFQKRLKEALDRARL